VPAPGRSVRFGVIIPARYGARRLPGKPLRQLAGKPMILHVLERSQNSGAAFVIVATDDERIAEVVVAAGGEARLTSAGHASGTDRIAEVARCMQLPEEAIVVNVQGDEPLVDPALISRLAHVLASRPDADLATAATPIRSQRELADPNVVKVVTDCSGLALYFSRAPIPWVGDPPAMDAGLQDGVSSKFEFLRHVGIYAYRVAALIRLAEHPVVAVEGAESLEQLRALWLKLPIHVSVVQPLQGHGVDSEDDLARAEHILRGLGHGPSAG
jgi:3-deoxy-manno-octulosonate cytidylyltransferase (CMP-KDO synthetase)